MKNSVYAIVCCPICTRTSVVEFADIHMRSLLYGNADMVLHCVYDDASWIATDTERTRVAKLWEENKVVWQHGCLRLSDERAIFVNA